MKNHTESLPTFSIPSPLLVPLAAVSVAFAIIAPAFGKDSGAQSDGGKSTGGAKASAAKVDAAKSRTAGTKDGDGGAAALEAMIADLTGALTRSQKSRLLDLLNEAPPEELAAIPGLGPSKAAALVGARPIEKLEDLLEIRGIGPALYGRIMAYAQEGAAASTADKAKAPSQGGKAKTPAPAKSKPTAKPRSGSRDSKTMKA